MLTNFLPSRLRAIISSMNESPSSNPPTTPLVTNDSVLETERDTGQLDASDSSRKVSAETSETNFLHTIDSPPVSEVYLDPLSPRSLMLKNIGKFDHLFEKGYDSDQEEGPWCGMEEEEGPQDFDEDELLENVAELH